VVERRKLPDTRGGLTHRFVILAMEQGEPVEVKGYVTTGCYEDGAVGEIFVKIQKPGYPINGFTDAWAVCVSLLLQTGMPLEAVVRKFRGYRYEPSGRIQGRGDVLALSPIDYICRWLAETYLDDGS